MTARHYSNSQNSMIFFGYVDFYPKNLSNFVSLPWKLHNRYCHSIYVWQIGGKQTKIYRFFSTKLVCMGGMYKHSHLDNLPYGHHKKMYS